jgi:hypothetical protein
VSAVGNRPKHQKMALLLSRSGPLTSLKPLFSAICAYLSRFFRNGERNRNPAFAPLAAFC